MTHVPSGRERLRSKRKRSRDIGFNAVILIGASAMGAAADFAVKALGIGLPPFFFTAFWGSGAILLLLAAATSKRRKRMSEEETRDRA